MTESETVALTPTSEGASLMTDDRFILSDKDYEEWKAALEKAEEAKKEARCDNKTNKLSEIITRKNHEKMKNYFIEKNNERSGWVLD